MAQDYLAGMMKHMTDYGMEVVGAIAMGLGGFIPGYVVSWILKKCGILRTSDKVQEVGVDAEVPVPAYPESMQSRDYN